MIYIDFNDKRAYYEQIRDNIKSLIISGVFEENQQLPSIRELSTTLTINPNTIQRAYRELENEGYIISVKGKGNFVTKIKIKEYKIKEKYEKIVELSKEIIFLGENKEEFIKKLEKELT